MIVTRWDADGTPTCMGTHLLKYVDSFYVNELLKYDSNKKEKILIDVESNQNKKTKNKKKRETDDDQSDRRF